MDGSCPTVQRCAMSYRRRQCQRVRLSQIESTLSCSIREVRQAPMRHIDSSLYVISAAHFAIPFLSSDTTRPSTAYHTTYRRVGGNKQGFQNCPLPCHCKIWYNFRHETSIGVAVRKLSRLAGIPDGCAKLCKRGTRLAHQLPAKPPHVPQTINAKAKVWPPTIKQPKTYCI